MVNCYVCIYWIVISHGWHQLFLWNLLWIYKEYVLYKHNKCIYKVLEQKVDDSNMQSNLRKHFSNLGSIRGWHGILYLRRWKVFKNQIAKKVLRSAKLPLDICYNNTQNTFLNHLNCEQVWAIFVFLIYIFIMKLIYDTNIPL